MFSWIVRAGLAGAIFNAACAMEPFNSESQRFDIRGGEEVVGHAGLVEINGCTGTMLSEHVIVTAAHCLDELSGSHSFAIDYFHPENGRERIWDGPAKYALHPDYGGWQCDPSLGCDFADHDIAVIWNDSRWWRTTYRDYVRVYQDYGDRIDAIRAWGQGYNTYSGKGLGTLRHHLFPLNWDPTYWVLETEGTDEHNICKGDSGGPAIKEVNGMELITGVHSFIEHQATNDNCSRDGGDQWHTRTNGQHLDWIAETTGTTCAKLSAHSFSYARCFEIPYINEVPEEGLLRNQAVARATTFL